MMRPALLTVYVVLMPVIFFPMAEMQAPTITAEPSSPLSVVEGQSLTLEWTYNIHGDLFILTQFAPQGESFIVQKIIGVENISIGESFKDRVTANVSNSFALITFQTVNRSDSKTYDFTVHNSPGGQTVRPLEITVQFPPSFNSPSPDQVVMEGDPALITLPCNVDGIPPPNIIWTKVLPNGSDSDVLFTNIGQPYTYQFTNNRNNAGTYRCKADNGIGSAINQTIDVTINFKPENVQLIVNDSNVCLDDVISVSCSADGNPVVHIYQLFENDVLVSNSSSPIVWSKSASTGGVFVYRCEAINLVGTANSTTTVTVNVPPAIEQLSNITVTEGENRNLACCVTGIPVPTVLWTTVGSGSRTEGNIRQLTNISRNEDGEYKCDASNLCGNDSKSTYLTVQFRPENVQLTVNDSNICKGDVISVSCSADGNPVVHIYQLFENDSLVNNSSSPIAWSKSASTGGVFVYRCVANNTVGTASSTKTITVYVPSSIQAIPDKNITEGENLTLTCHAFGTPPPTVSWIKVSSGQRTNGNVLELTNITRSEAGDYRCEASNECGNSSELVTIDVQYKPENVQFMANATGDKVCQNDTVKFSCSADANPQVTSYRLFKNDTALKKSSSGMWSKTLSSSGLFIYHCVANNTIGTASSMSSVSITVNEPSSIQAIPDEKITEGENLTLTCQSSGTPPLTVTWIKVSSGQPTNGHVLELTNINRSEAGDYRCEASNECGNASELVNIDVQYKPENVQLTTNATGDKACQNETVKFSSSADANPPVTSYQLFKNDTALETSSSGMWSKTLSSSGLFIYHCVANNTIGTASSALSTPITVNERSSIQAIPDEKITEGENLTLTCQASGTPPPTVSWIKVSSGQRTNGHMLELTNINRSEAGDYRCEASNECGNASELVNIDVQYKPENAQLTANATADKACQNETVKFSCSADANPPVTSYQLFKNDTALEKSGSGMWSKTQSSSGLFIYKCVANNTIGTASSALSVPITVNVRSSIPPIPDQIKTEGDNLTLPCQASGTPPPTVSWIKVGSGQRTNGYILELININRNEAGDYRCEASNECGNSSELVTINVQYPPSITDISAIQALNVGATVTLNCTADGNPAPNITWTKVSDGSVVTMPLTITDKQDEGAYRCTADNDVGSPVTSDVSIIVHFPASIVPLKKSNIVKKGGSITLFCNVSGQPAPSATWTHIDSGKRVNNKTWVIDNIGERDLGEYQCDASNMYGNATDSTEILFEGGRCEKQCSSGRECLPIGSFHSCLCSDKRKKGTNCDQTEALKKVIEARIRFTNKEYKEEYNNLEDPVTVKFVKYIEGNCTEEYKANSKGLKFKKCKVTKLSPGSVIAHMELQFEEDVSESEIRVLTQKITEDRNLGQLEIDPVSVGPTQPHFSTAVPSVPTKVNKDVIYGPVIGVLALILVSGIIYFIIKTQRRQQADRQNENRDKLRGYHFNMGIEDEMNHEEFGPRHYMELGEVTQSQEEGTEPSPYLEINDYAPLHPSTRSWEVPRENVIIEKVIGKGAFGQVAQGTVSQLRGREGTTTVAVKMLKASAPESDRKDLLSELEVMKTLKPHRHVIKLLGCVTEFDPVLVIIEYVPYGDLLGYLRKSRGLNDTYFKDPDVKPQTSLTSQQLMKFSWHVADGMSYLSSRNIIHRDLAARNVLVGEQETCKVTDFGMARDVQQENIYERKTKGRIPVKWTAYEALMYGLYTTKSDVWSFGVVLYEIFTVGGSPYPRMDGRKMPELLAQGYRMPKPSHVDDALYQIMLNCWQEDPDDRPTFENLRRELKQMENQHKRLINMKDYDKKLYENVEDLVF